MRLLSWKSCALVVWCFLFYVGPVISEDHSMHQHQVEPTPVTKKALYFCPMHPQITSDHPGYCPICHMTLEKAEEPQAKDGTPAGTPPQAPTMKGNVGRSSFFLSPEKQAVIGMQTALVQHDSVTEKVRAFGKVDYDPTAYSVIEEYKIAQKAHSDGVLQAAKRKLELIGFSEGAVSKLGGEVSAFLTPGEAVFVRGEVLEADAALIKVGQRFKARASAIPGKVYDGEVIGIIPVINAGTRTLVLRGIVHDSERALRPEMFLDLQVDVDKVHGIFVPVDSVLRAGQENLAFVLFEGNRLEPREVLVGRQFGERLQVIGGLNEGEKVVTAANFLVDSESRLKAVLARSEGEKEDAKKADIAPVHSH